MFNSLASAHDPQRNSHFTYEVMQWCTRLCWQQMLQETILWEVRNRYRLTSGTEPLISGTAGYCTFPHPFSSSCKNTVVAWGPEGGHDGGNHSTFSLTETHWWKYYVLYTFCHSLFFPTELFKLQSKSYCCIYMFSLLSRKTLQMSSFLSEPTQSI